MAKDSKAEVTNYTEYAVIVFPDLATVVAEVNALMKRGWQPVGGLVVSAQGSNVMHFQAMAK